MSRPPETAGAAGVARLARAPAPLTLSARLRCDLVFRLLAGRPDARSLVEIGCGQGALGSLLARRYEYRGYEPDAESFRIAARRVAAAGGVVVNAVPPPSPDRAFDVAAAFEVLEHLEDDGAAVKGWSRWVRPGGILIVSVPAHPDRFGAADRYVGHVRRYTRERLTRVMHEAGLAHVRVLSYGFPLGYFLEWGRNLVLGRRARTMPAMARTAASGRTLQPGGVLTSLVLAAALPFQLAQRPFAGGDRGTGYVALGERGE